MGGVKQHPPYHHQLEPSIWIVLWMFPSFILGANKRRALVKGNPKIEALKNLNTTEWMRLEKGYIQHFLLSSHHPSSIQSGTLESLVQATMSNRVNFNSLPTHPPIHSIHSIQPTKHKFNHNPTHKNRAELRAQQTQIQSPIRAIKLNLGTFMNCNGSPIQFDQNLEGGLGVILVMISHAVFVLKCWAATRWISRIHDFFVSWSYYTRKRHGDLLLPGDMMSSYWIIS